ncbi:MAG: hypothetical protein IKI75_13245 [Lachnospiraceae bacterium]|nr:hypothetical protein [Lachnospiraceae bacterium]
MGERIVYKSDFSFTPTGDFSNGRLQVDAIRLLDFKAFYDSGWIELNRITMLLGKNSIGKSSITQAIQMIKLCYDKLQQGQKSPGLIALEDEFGTFDELKNNASENRSFTVILRLKSDNSEYSYSIIVDGSGLESRINIRLFDKDELVYETGSTDEVVNVFFVSFSETDYKDTNTDLFVAAVNGVKEFASKLEYMEPIRYTPHRRYSVSGTMASSVGVRGDNTYDMLFYLSQIEHDVPSAVKEWLSMFGYELVWKPEEKRRNEGAFWLRNIKTNIMTNIIDNGFGILQSLPIVLAMAMKKEGLLVIDTPEAHLQSPIESSFADIIESTMKDGLSIMLETGSEQILLRLRKLIAEQRISPEDVSCYFIDESEDDRSIKAIQLTISEDGMMEADNTSFYNFFSGSVLDLMEIKKIQYERIKGRQNE